MDELSLLSKDILETIMREDREYEFKKNKSYVERNVIASKFKKNIVGLTNQDINKIISD